MESLGLDELEGLITRLLAVGVDVVEIDIVDTAREIQDHVAIAALGGLSLEIEVENIGIGAAGHDVLAEPADQPGLRSRH